MRTPSVRNDPMTRRQGRAYVTGNITMLCHYCGAALTDATLTVDHVRPRSKGGKTEPGNIVPACDECNQKKGNRKVARER